MIEISIVVPVYNVEKYLKKCIESLINQTFKDLQIILVDDGSTDSSGSICDEYASRNRNIEVIHKENGGLSSARNEGLKRAAGNYIAFVDSDDWVHLKMYERLYNISKKYNADIVQCGYKRVNDEEEDIELKSSQFEVISNIEVLNNYYDDDKYVESVVVWNKLYKRELFEDITFPVGRINEDEYTTHKVIYKSNKIVKCTDPMYYYRNTPNSITNSGFSLKRLHVLGALKERYIFFKDKGEKELYEKTFEKYGRLLKIYYSKCRFLIDDNNEVLHSLIKEYRKIFKSYINNKYLSVGDIICSYIFYVMPDLYAIGVKVRGKYNINVK